MKRLNLSTSWMLSLPALALVLMGCASPGEALDPSVFQSIRENETTRAEVEKVMGKPQFATTGANGNTVTQYESVMGHAAPRSFGAAANFRYRRVSFLFDKSLLLRRKLMSESWNSIEAHRNDPAAQGKPLGADDVRRVAIPGADRTDLTAAFGPPSFEQLEVEGGSILVWVSMRQTRGPVLLNQAKADTQSVQVLVTPNGKVVSHRIQGLLSGENQGLPSPPSKKTPSSGDRL